MNVHTTWKKVERLVADRFVVFQLALPASTRYPLLGGEVKRQLEIRSSGEETGSNAPIFAPVFSLAINVERSNMALAIA